MKPIRIVSYDIIKAFGIFLVCFYHCSMLSIDFLATPTVTVYFNYFVYGISTMGVPLFFMINGALLFNRSYDIKKHAFKAVRILILITIWGVISLLLLKWIDNEQYSTAQFVKYFLQLDSNRIGYLWFLKAIIYLYIFFPFIKALFDTNKKYLWYMLAFIFVLTFFKFIPYIDWINPFNMNYSYALVYFILGGLLAQNTSYITMKTSYLVAIMVIAALLLFAVGVYQTNALSMIYDTVWQGYDMFIGFILTASFFLLCLRIETTNKQLQAVVKIIGDNTLGIYLIHMLITHFVLLYYPLKEASLMIGLLFSLFILLLSLGLTLLLKNIPFLNRLVKL